MTSFFFVFLRNRDTNLKLACLPARSPLPVAALPSVSPIPSAPLTNLRGLDRSKGYAIRGNWCNSCLVFVRAKVQRCYCFINAKWREFAECVSRGDPRSAPLREAHAGGTVAAATHQRVGDAALPPDICTFGDGIVFRRSRSTLALRRAFIRRRHAPLGMCRVSVETQRENASKRFLQKATKKTKIFWIQILQRNLVIVGVSGCRRFLRFVCFLLSVLLCARRRDFQRRQTRRQKGRNRF